MAVEGRCNCGSIRVTLDPVPKTQLLCYCDNCRRAGGALCSANLMVPKTHFSVADPSGALRTYADADTSSGRPVRRHFCGTCGSPVFSETQTRPDGAALKATLFLARGAWDLPPPEGELYAERKSAWERRVVDVQRAGEI